MTQFLAALGSWNFEPVSLLCMFSGSSRLALTASRPPFSMLVLPPLDLRYGWHLGHKPHQELVRQMIHFFKPSFVTGEPRCKYWSRSGVRRDKATTELRRREERPALDFNTEVMLHQVKTGRHGFMENPRTSAIWHESSANSLILSQHFAAYFTDQCCFVHGVPDGERSRKQTTFASSFELWHSCKRCRCSRGHIQLQGKCEDGTTNRTAKAALFPLRLCQALCQDISSASQHKDFHLDESLQCQDLMNDNEQRKKADNVFPAAPLPRISPPPGLGTDVLPELRPEYRPGLTGSNTLQLCGNVALISPDWDDNLKESMKYFFEAVSDQFKELPGSILLLPREDIPNDANTLHGISSFRETLRAGMDLDVLEIHINHDIIPSSFTSEGNDCFALLFVLEQDMRHVNIHLVPLKFLSSQQLRQRPVILCAGALTVLGMISAGLVRANTKTKLIREPPHVPLHPTTVLGSPSDVKVSGERDVHKPSHDFKEVPKQLLHADQKERKRLLVGLHQRFFHCGVTDMIRLLQAMMMPKDILHLGVEVCQQCSECQKFANKAPRPLLRGHVATQFNELVYQDLFFLWDQPFALYIDSCTHWKTGCRLENKQAPTLLKALMSQWIRIWGPMQTLCSDQEGGLGSAEATVFCERLGITRTFVGTAAYHSTGLIERHIGLTKHSMLILHEASRREGLNLSYDDIINEVTMCQNALLEKGGVTPQTAVTGVNPREYWNMDCAQLQSHTGALDVRADFAEQAIRGRLLAKQAILQAVVGERFAIARRTKQQKHDLSLLIPGMTVDIYRQPHRKDDYGWHGPAELVSVQRMTGTAIVVHQGQPLVLPLNHIRRHVAMDYFNEVLSAHTDDTSVTFHFTAKGEIRQPAVPQSYKILQQLIDATPPGKCIWIGYKVKEDLTGVWVPTFQEFVKHPVYRAVEQSDLQQHLGQIHGLLYGTDLRRIPCPRQHSQGLLLRWNRVTPHQYELTQLRLSATKTFAPHQGWSTLFLYTYREAAEDPRVKKETIDWDDISSIDPRSIPPDSDSDQESMESEHPHAPQDHSMFDPPQAPPPSVPPAPQQPPFPFTSSSTSAPSAPQQPPFVPPATLPPVTEESMNEDESTLPELQAPPTYNDGPPPSPPSPQAIAEQPLRLPQQPHFPSLPELRPSSNTNYQRHFYACTSTTITAETTFHCQR